jgi:hypothetical protein
VTSITILNRNAAPGETVSRWNSAKKPPTPAWTRPDWFCCVNFFRARFGYPRGFFGGQGIELLGGGQLLGVGRDHLAFLEQVQEFDTLEGHPGRTKGLELPHRADEPFDGSMSLLHPIV